MQHKPLLATTTTTTITALLLLCALTPTTLHARAHKFVGQQQQGAPPPSRAAAASSSSSTGVSKTAQPKAETKFARLIERLSEPSGYFDTDNLISNEASYLHVLGKMRQMNATGGAYIGVGPDQNFSYIAQVRPRVAFIIDIRRDNLLQHLLFKALFAEARNRIEYLCLLFGRPFPAKSDQWKTRGISELVEYIEQTPARRELFDATHATLQAKAKSFGVPLTPAELETINRIHLNFYTEGMELRYTSRNRSPRPYYPTYRQLLLEKDLSGRQANYLASEDDFQFVKSLEKRDLIVPVVGNVSGDYALKAIGRELSARNERVSAFYLSNIEFYLWREGGFDRFAKNLAELPRDSRSLIVRSYFGGSYGYVHPQSTPGYYSTQLLQTIDSLIQEHASGGYESYSDLMTKHALDLR